MLNRQTRCRALFALTLILLLVLPPQPAHAYSVLSHEQVVDLVWKSHIVPLLRRRYPTITDDQVKEAHAYAYGGAIIQDIGYYPYGKKFVSDLTHYFRSGDFILSLLRNSQDLNEYAFALGSLAHYASDNYGHRLATNVAVPLLYPELRKKYGPVVTYEDNPTAHIKTEFAFDVLQVAKGHYAPDSYHAFVGFEVSMPLLERAFRDTYGLELRSIISNEEKAANSYRHSVNGLIPKATRVAWNLKQDEIQKDMPGITQKKFLYNLSRASYEKEWGKDYQRPTAGDKFLAFVIRILPKIGPLRILTFRTPTPEAQKLFENSFNTTVDQYRALLSDWSKGQLQLVNDNFDMGEITPRGKYKLADKTCAQLLDRLAKQHMAGVDQELKTQMLAFYATKENSGARKKHDKSEAKIQQEIKELQESPAVATNAGE